jgi:hypothetical protein
LLSSLEMENPELEEEVKATTVIVHDGRFAYLKVKEPVLGDHFLVSQDKDEVTVVTEEKNVQDLKFEKDEKWYKLLEFKITKPFLCVGFLATISKTIAEKGMNILLVSTFSKDYALVREKNLEQALTALRERGFSIS